jgi:hypothetical protein
MRKEARRQATADAVVSPSPLIHLVFRPCPWLDLVD